MQKYSLKFESADDGRVATLSFLAKSTSGALDTAKKSADGSWAELSCDGKLICKLQLVEETGVWLVHPV